MAGRPLYARLRVRGWLLLESPLHVGGAGGDRSVDLPLARDGGGDHYVPGTSLAGCLRACAEGVGERSSSTRWGYIVERTEQGAVSRVVVGDARVLAADGASSAIVEEIRDGVGIDRVLGASAPGILYSRAVLPRGSRLELAVDIESRTSDELEDDYQFLVALLAALGRGDAPLGAGKTRGLGALTLLTGPGDLAVTEERFDCRASVIAALRSPRDVTADVMSLVGRAEPSWPRRVVRVTMPWVAAGPVMVRASVEGLRVDGLPLVGRRDGNRLVPVIPGASIKGALRARAEWILRSLAGVDADRAGRAEEFADQSEGGALALVRALFGAPPVGKQAKDAPPDTRGIGALAVNDCYARTADLSNELWIEALSPEEATRTEGEQQRRRAAWSRRMVEAGYHPTHHVAIDRWTGGAAAGLLYSVLEPEGVSWDPISIGISCDRLDRVGAGLVEPALALVWLLVRDLGEGLVPLGYAVNRGMGDVKVDPRTVTWSGLPGHDNGRTVSHDQLDVSAWAGAWESYIAEAGG